MSLFVVPAQVHEIGGGQVGAEAESELTGKQEAGEQHSTQAQSNHPDRYHHYLG